MERRQFFLLLFGPGLQILSLLLPLLALESSGGQEHQWSRQAPQAKQGVTSTATLRKAELSAMDKQELTPWDRAWNNILSI